MLKGRPIGILVPLSALVGLACSESPPYSVTVQALHESGAPAAGVGIRARISERGHERLAHKTDSSGIAEITLSEPTTLGLVGWASKPRYHKVEGGGLVGFLLPDPCQVSIAARGPSGDLITPLSVLISVEKTEEWDSSTATLDSSTNGGEMTMTTACGVASYAVSAGSGYAPVHRSELVVSPNTTLAIDMVPGLPLEGKVTDPSGAPLPQTTVAEAGIAYTMSSADGTYSILLDPRHEHTLRFHHLGSTPVLRTIPKGGIPPTLDVVLSPFERN